MKIHCFRCGKPVSTEVPDTTIIRAWVECPECIENDANMVKQKAPVWAGFIRDKG